MPAVGGSGSPPTHAQEMAFFFSPGGFSSEKDKQLVNNRPGSGPSLHPGPGDSGDSAPRPVAEDQAIVIPPGGAAHVKTISSRACLSQVLPYIEPKQMLLLQK